MSQVNQRMSPETIDPRLSNPWLSQVAVVEGIRHEISGVATYRLRIMEQRAAAAYRFRAGQFNMLYVPGCGEVAISLSGSPFRDGTELLHTIRVAGRVTHAIAKLKIGDQIGLRGPYGASWPTSQCEPRDVSSPQDVIIVAGGIGLAPLRPVLYELLERRSEFARIVLLYGARSPDLVLYANEFARWKEQGVEIQTTVDQANQQWTGSVGVVSLLLDRLAKLRPVQSVMMMCGPEVMMHYAALSAIDRGIAKDAIWISAERNMQCAVGLCGHCQLGPLFICRQGPVFRYDVIEPYMKVRDL